jgi:hypothetical protein
MGLARYVASNHWTDGSITQDRQHVASNALGPGFLHAAQEAAGDDGPEEAGTVTAHGTSRLFVQRHYKGISGALWASSSWAAV